MSWLTFPTDPLLTDFERLEGGDARVLLRRGYEEEAEALGLTGGEIVAVGRVEGGREPHPIVELGTGERAVIRRYRRGGLLRHLNPDRYFLGNRALAEVRLTEAARAAGVRVPLVIAAVERPLAAGYAAWLVTCWIDGARELAGALLEASSETRRALLQEAGKQIGRMHAAGVAHPDLNLRNILVAGDEAGAYELYLIDFDRGKLFSGSVPDRRRRADLQRLARSARKLKASITAAGWDALRSGYGAGWPGDLELAG